MSKKTIVTVSIVLVIILLGLVGYYFIAQNGDNSSGGIVNGFKNFLPFGGNNSSQNNSSTTGNETGNEQTPVSTTEFTQKLRKITSEQVAGAGTLDVKAGTILRYIEKATGHIFEVELFSPNKNRISNTTIPVVYDAVWGNKNNSLIARYLKNDDQTIDTYSLTVKNVSTTTENTISGTLFGSYISDVSVFGNSVFYVMQNSNSSSGIVQNFDGSGKKQIWNSPIKELASQFINSKTVSLTTKPSQNINGYMYFIDTGTGATKQILSNISGLTTLTNPSANVVLYTELTANASMYSYDVSTEAKTSISPSTFPEKCVWSAKDKYTVFCAVPRQSISGDSLEKWYKGTESFTDDIWKFDTKNNTSTMLSGLENESIDVIKPILSENEQYFVFMNKTDNSLWSLDLTK